MYSKNPAFLIATSNFRYWGNIAVNKRYWISTDRIVLNVFNMFYMFIKKTNIYLEILYSMFRNEAKFVVRYLIAQVTWTWQWIYLLNLIDLFQTRSALGITKTNVRHPNILTKLQQSIFLHNKPLSHKITLFIFQHNFYFTKLISLGIKWYLGLQYYPCI